MIPVPQTVLDSISASFDISTERLVQIGGGKEYSDGVVYTYPYQNTSRVLKVMALDSSDSAGFARLEERLKFIHFLGENGVYIVYPIARADGSLFTSAQEGEKIFVAYVMDKVSGRHPRAEQLDAAYFHHVGQTIGRLHRITQQYPSGQCQVTDPVSGKPILGWEQEVESFIQWCTDAQVKRCWKAMRERLAALSVTRDAYGFIHNDPHNENVLMSSSGDRLVLLDFDVANYHWFMTDISIAMQGLLFSRTGGLDRPLGQRALLRQMVDVFMLGYETENHLDPAWLGMFDLFVSYRRLLLFTVMQGWLKKNAKVRSVWKKMILEEPPLLNG